MRPCHALDAASEARARLTACRLIVRILHLSKFYPPHRGGIERYVELLAKAQRAAGLRVGVLAHGTPGSPRPRRAWREAGVLLVEARTRMELVYTPISPAWPLRLGQLLQRFKPDLLHLHLPNPWAFLLLGHPGARRIPWIVHWHADVPDASGSRAMRMALPVYRQMEQALLTRSHRIITTSESYAASSPQLRRHAGKVQTVPLAVAPAQPAQAGSVWPGPGLRLLAVGRLTYYKGLQVLLHALALIEGCSLVIVGEGEQRDALQRHVAQLGLGDRVSLAGNLDDEMLDATYRDADVLCLASLDRAEAFGLVLLEAMRAGKPCIASRVAGSGMTEVVQDQHCGLLVEPGSPHDLASAITRLRDNAELRRQYGNAGQERWQARYRIEQSVAAITAIYQESLVTP